MDLTWEETAHIGDEQSDAWDAVIRARYGETWAEWYAAAYASERLGGASELTARMRAYWEMRRRVEG